MATIVIFADIEQGHTFPTFCLAKKLMARGHRVCYLGLAEAEDTIRSQGFEFHRVMDGLLSSGDLSRRRAEANKPRAQQSRLVEARCYGALMRDKGIEALLKELKPDVALMLSYSYFSAIIVRHHYNLPVVLLNTSVMCEPRTQACRSVIDDLIQVPGTTDLIDLLLSARVEIKNFADVADLILRMPELVLHPEIFELPDTIRGPLLFYGGHEVDLKRVEGPYDWDQLHADRPLVYCSLGSQPDFRVEVSRRFIRTVIDTAARQSNWQFVVSLGTRLNAKEFEPLPPQVILSHWAPQLQLLARASVMITHAGIGTVKECILHEVPMLAVPLTRDQPHVADRIERHGLGLRGEIERITPEELSSMLDRLITNESIRERLKLMRENFERAEAQDISVTLIEKVIAGSLPVNTL